MLWVGNQHQGIFAQRQDFQLRIASRIGYQAQIHHIADHIFIHLVGAAVFDVNIDGWIILQEFFHIRRQVVQSDAVNGCHPDSPRDDFLNLLKFVVQGVISVDDLLAVIVEHLAFARQTEPFLAALNQERFEQPLQRADLLAHRRLGDLVNLRGLGKTLRLGQIAEYFETLDLHKRYKYKVAASESTNVFLNKG